MDGANATTATTPEAKPAPASNQPAQPDSTFQQPPVGTQERPGAPDLYRENYELRQRIAAFDAAQRAAVEAEQRKVTDALAEKGRTSEALESERQRASQREQELIDRIEAAQKVVIREKAEAFKARLLAGKTFSGADDATRSGQQRIVESLIDSWLDHDADASGNISFVDRESRRPALDELSRRLSSPELAAFFAPSTRGGPGTDGARPSAPPQTLPPQAATPEERVRAWRSGGYIPPLVSK